MGLAGEAVVARPDKLEETQIAKALQLLSDFFFHMPVLGMQPVQFVGEAVNFP